MRFDQEGSPSFLCDPRPVFLLWYSVKIRRPKLSRNFTLEIIAEIAISRDRHQLFHSNIEQILAK